MEDAVRLKSLYPGNNAVHIENQQNMVVQNWSALQERSAHRREALQASCDLHRFLAQVYKFKTIVSKEKNSILYFKMRCIFFHRYVI